MNRDSSSSERQCDLSPLPHAFHSRFTPQSPEMCANLLADGCFSPLAFLSLVVASYPPSQASRAPSRGVPTQNSPPFPAVFFLGPEIVESAGLVNLGLNPVTRARYRLPRGLATEKLFPNRGLGHIRLLQEGSQRSQTWIIADVRQAPCSDAPSQEVLTVLGVSWIEKR